MSAIQLNAQQAALLQAIDSTLDTLLASGAEFPSGTSVLPGITGYPTIATNYKLQARQSLEQIFGAMLTTPPIFTNASLINGWGNIGAGYALAAYAQDALGRIWLRGSISGGISSGGETAFVLPIGLRPPATMEFSYNSTGIFIGTDGSVVPQSNAHISLAGISFTTV